MLTLRGALRGAGAAKTTRYRYARCCVDQNTRNISIMWPRARHELRLTGVVSGGEAKLCVIEAPQSKRN